MNIYPSNHFARFRSTILFDTKYGVYGHKKPKNSILVKTFVCL